MGYADDVVEAKNDLKAHIDLETNDTQRHFLLGRLALLMNWAHEKAKEVDDERAK